MGLNYYVSAYEAEIVILENVRARAEAACYLPHDYTPPLDSRVRLPRLLTTRFAAKDGIMGVSVFTLETPACSKRRRKPAKTGCHGHKTSSWTMESCSVVHVLATTPKATPDPGSEPVRAAPAMRHERWS